MSEDAHVLMFAWVVFFSLFVLFGGIFWFLARREQKKSLYSEMPVRKLIDLPYSSLRQILQYVQEHHDIYNPLLNIATATICRETGRIFPDTIDFLGRIHVSWRFLKERYSGVLVSWGSLTKEQQHTIREVLGDSILGFQLDLSSSVASPMRIDPFYAAVKPGPCYVNIETKTMVGWQEIPGTDFEYLIVRVPCKKF